MGELLTECHLSDGLARQAHQAFLNDLQRGHHARLVVATAMQARFAHALRSQGKDVHVDGLGQRVMSVHPDIYWEMIRRHGAGCWRDKRFRREMMRDEPSLVVESEARQTTVRVPGRRRARA